MWLVTENPHKLREAVAILSEDKIRVGQSHRRKIEIQSQDLEKICIHAAKEVAKSELRPFIVEDSALFIRALKGFPGPFSAYVYRTIGIDGILQLMKGVKMRDAYFQSTVATCLGRKICKTFSGRINGSISHHEAGKHGFGYDPVFVPRGDSLTFGEMSLSEKNRHSHRALALRKFARWFLSQ